MAEIWKKWEPVKGLAKKYYIDAVIDDINGFKVELSNRDNEERLIIHFSESVWTYRSVEEGLRISTLEMLSRKYGTNFYTEWTFFTIENSNYLNWIYKESCVANQNNGLIHFCLMAMDDILDIVADYEPQIQHLSD